MTTDTTGGKHQFQSVIVGKDVCVMRIHNCHRLEACWDWVFTSNRKMKAWDLALSCPVLRGRPRWYNWRFAPLLETGWDVGPETLCCGACTWTNVSLNGRYKEALGTKNNSMHGQLGQIINNKIRKGPKPAATFEVPICQEQKRNYKKYYTWSLHAEPPQRGRQTLWSAPALTACKGPARPCSRSQQRRLLFALALLFCGSSSNKALPEFLIWPCIDFYWLGKSNKLSW